MSNFYEITFCVIVIFSNANPVSFSFKFFSHLKSHLSSSIIITFVLIFQLLNDLCQTCHCQRVIDVGAGQGHLSRLLSFGYGLTVTTVEAAGCHAPKAAKFDG